MCLQGCSREHDTYLLLKYNLQISRITTTPQVSTCLLLLSISSSEPESKIYPNCKPSLKGAWLNYCSVVAESHAPAVLEP